MLKQLLQRVTFEVVGIVALAFAAGVAVISAAYGLYALLRTSLSAAASAGLTSLAAVILVAVLAVVLIQLAKKSRLRPTRNAGASIPIRSSSADRGRRTGWRAGRCGPAAPP